MGLDKINKKFLIGLDVGTTSIKGVILSNKGNIYATVGKEYLLETKGSDICELEAEVYWNTTQDVIKELLEKSGITSDKIVALAFSSQGETLIVVDKNGNPLRKAIVWMDNRSDKEAKQIEQNFGAINIFKITGQPKTIPMWPATKILWLKNNEPDIFNKVSKFLLVEDYLLYKLTGKYFTEESLVSSTLYFDIQKKKWWDTMLNYLNISSEQLPKVYPSGKIVATLTRTAARLTGLSEATIAVTGAYDHAAGAIGAGNISSGIITETTGGAMAMCVTLDSPVFDLNLNLPCQCHAIPNKYFLQPYGQTAGMVLKWFRDNFGKIELEKAVKNKTNTYDLLTSLASEIPPGSEGLIMLPHLMGTGSPEFDLNAKGIFAGITLNMSKGHFIRAIMESVVCIIKNNIDSLSCLNYSVKEIRVLGGGAKSTLWNQIKADMLELPIVTLTNKEVPSIGAAILAGVGSNVFSNIKDGCDSVVTMKDRYIPVPEKSEIYKEVYQKYLKLYQLNKPLWSE
jgi:xylulokinase